MADVTGEAPPQSLGGASRFPVYTDIPSRLSADAWRALRWLAVAAPLGVAAFVLADPPRGLMLFWQIVVPSLPLLFAVAPGLWRQICPMASANQAAAHMPRAQGRTLSPAALDTAYLVAAAAFVMLIVAKRPLLLDAPKATALLIVGSLALAALGGLVLKGRSGWCGTFCPLGPLQRLYGHAPPVLVANGYCPTCVGCQRNCYDFNPMAAIHADLEENASGRREGGRKEHVALFAALLPGLVLGSWYADTFGERGPLAYLWEFAAYLLGSAGLFLFLRALLPISLYRLSAIFGMAALVLFYWIETAPMAGAIANFTGVLLPYPATTILVTGIAALVALRVLATGLANEAAYEQAQRQWQEPRVGVDRIALDAGKAHAARIAVRDAASGRTFSAERGRTLLDILDSGGVVLPYGCRTGVCGADPILIREGAANLAAPGEAETATLRRLGMPAEARLACMCRVAGPVTIDLGAGLARAAAAPGAHASDGVPDPLASNGIGRVVIIGNGVAGTTVAERLRAASPGCSIDVVAAEDRHFYNRMSLGRALYGRSGLEGLQMLPTEWFEQRRVTVWLNTLATAIDRERNEVRLGTGERLAYDRLVLAQGAVPNEPEIPGARLEGVFALRRASDALGLRAWSQATGCRDAVVVGGGTLGIETAWALKTLGLRVVLVHRGARLMADTLDAKGSGIVERYLSGSGIEVRTRCSIRAVEGKRRVTGLTLDDGTQLPAELALFCIGVTPDVALARAAGLHVGRGVVTDETMRTSDPRILAVGDVAETEPPMRKLWTVAAAQAERAVDGLLGLSLRDLPAPVTHLKCPGIDAFAFGAAADGGTESRAHPDDGDNESRTIVVRDGRIIGASFVGPPGTGRAFQTLVDLAGGAGDRELRLCNGDWSALDEA